MPTKKQAEEAMEKLKKYITYARCDTVKSIDLGKDPINKEWTIYLTLVNTNWLGWPLFIDDVPVEVEYVGRSIFC